MTQLVRDTIRNFTDILTKEQTEILRAAALLMIPTLLTKISGQVVTMLIATRLGTGASISEFNLANTLPEALLNILLLGVMGVVLIPVLIERKEHDEKQFLRLFNTILNLALLLFIVATILVFFFADSFFPWLLDNVIHPQLADYPSPESLVRIIDMTKVLMLPNLILAISVLISSGLQVYNRLIVPHLAPLFYNLGRLFSVFVLLPLTGDSPWALVHGVIIGSMLHLLIQIPLARMLNLNYIPVLDWRDKYLHKILLVSIPRGFAFASETVGLTIQRFLATGMGAISVFNYANSLALVIPTIFGSAFAFASFPTLSRLYTQGKHEEISVLVARTLNQIFFLAIPFTIAMLVLRLPITRLVYGLLPNTQFTREDTLAVAWTLMFFSVGMMFEGMRWYLYRLYYVAQNTWIPLVTSLFSLLGTVAISYVLANWFSHADGYSLRSLPLEIGYFFIRNDSPAAVGGLSLAFSITSIVESLVLIVVANYKVVKLDFAALGAGLWRKFLPTSVMTVLMYFMYRTWDTYSFPIDATPGFRGSTTFNLFILTSITVFTSFMVYYLLCYLFQVEELKILRRFLNPIFRLGGLRIRG